MAEGGRIGHSRQARLLQKAAAWVCRGPRGSSFSWVSGGRSGGYQTIETEALLLACPNFLSDLVDVISPCCLLPVVKSRYTANLKVLWALPEKIGPEFKTLSAWVGSAYTCFRFFTVERGKTGKWRVERKVRRHCGQSRPSSPSSFQGARGRYVA